MESSDSNLDSSDADNFLNQMRDLHKRTDNQAENSFLAMGNYQPGEDSRPAHMRRNPKRHLK